MSLDKYCLKDPGYLELVTKQFKTALKYGSLVMFSTYIAKQALSLHFLT